MYPVGIWAPIPSVRGEGIKVQDVESCMWVGDEAFCTDEVNVFLGEAQDQVAPGMAVEGSLIVHVSGSLQGRDYGTLGGQEVCDRLLHLFCYVSFIILGVVSGSLDHCTGGRLHKPRGCLHKALQVQLDRNNTFISLSTQDQQRQ